MNVVSLPSERSQAYWKSTLENWLNLNLPSQNTNNTTPNFKDIPFYFDQSMSQKMLEFSRQYNGNLYSFLYLGLIETLSQITRQDDIAIGTYACDANNDACKLVIRQKLNRKLSFTEQYGQTTLNLFKAYEHRDAGLEAFLQTLKIPGQNAFKIMLTLVDENGHNMLHLPCREVKCLTFPCHDPNAELSFSLQYTDNGIRGMLRYDENTYPSTFVQNLVFNFESVLNANLNNLN